MTVGRAVLTKGLRLPAVLREEPQYRRSSAAGALDPRGPVTSGPAVRSAGNGLAPSASRAGVRGPVPASSSCWPCGRGLGDRLDRKRILIVSDLVRLCASWSPPPAAGGGADGAGPGDIAAVYGAADAFFAPAFTGLLPATVSPVNLQAAERAARAAFSLGQPRGSDRGGLLIAFAGGPGGALLFDRLDVRRLDRTAAAAAAAGVEEGLHEEDPTAIDATLLDQPARGLGRCASRSWLVAFLPG
jgi:hypothetical protein